jgi:hypothetical protein
MASPVHPLQALAVYAEALVVRRRVVVFGEAGTGIEERLEELGALTVERVGPEDDLSAWRGTRFDVALVTDLGSFDDPEDLLARVRLAVGDAGVALVAAANRDVAGPEAAGAFDYYDLFDLVAGQFADVRMIARLPFHGVTLAEVSEDDSPAVSVDTQLADEDHSPEAFIALASQRGVSLDPYAIIELPPPRLAVDDGARSRALALLALEEALAQERSRTQALSEQVQALEARASSATELERELLARRRQIVELSSEVEEKRAAAEAGGVAAAQVGDLALRAERAERLVARVEPELVRLSEAHALELARLEEALFERAGIVQQLEAELARRERMVLDLIHTLEEHSGPRSSPEPEPRAPHDERIEMALAEENARLRERLDALALDLARREGEAQAAAWSIAELERRLEPSSDRAVPHAGDQENRLAAVLDELDALRKALVQEHEARARAESAAAAGAAGKGVSGSDLPA